MLVPAAVDEDVVERGTEAGYPDALAGEEATNQCLDVVTRSEEVQETADGIQETTNLSDGQVAAIALARRRDVRCLTDDHAARTTAESLGLDVGGTMYVLLQARNTGRLSEEAYSNRIDDLSDSGFRMSATLYRRAIEAGTDLDPESDR